MTLKISKDTRQSIALIFIVLLYILNAAAVNIQYAKSIRYMNDLNTELTAEVERLESEILSIQPNHTPMPIVLESKEDSGTGCVSFPTTEHNAAYWSDFIITIGPLLEQYPHMLQYTLLMEYAGNAGNTDHAAELFNSMLPVPGKE